MERNPAIKDAVLIFGVPVTTFCCLILMFGVYTRYFKDQLQEPAPSPTASPIALESPPIIQIPETSTDTLGICQPINQKHPTASQALQQLLEKYPNANTREIFFCNYAGPDATGKCTKVQRLSLPNLVHQSDKLCLLKGNGFNQYNNDGFYPGKHASKPAPGAYRGF